jgi:maleylacetoacetate isomerase
MSATATSDTSTKRLKTSDSNSECKSTSMTSECESYVLYSYFRSSCSCRVRQVMNYKNIPYTLHPVHLVKGQQHADDYKLINPMAEVPSLQITNNRTKQIQYLGQSVAICLYLNDKYPSKSILPSDIFLRAKCLQLVETISSDTQPVTNLRILNNIEALTNTTDKTNWIHKYMKNGLLAFEQQLNGISGKYCIGDDISLADFVLIPQMYNARRFNIDLNNGQFTNILRIENNLKDFDWFKAAHPDNQPDNDVKPESK